MKLIKLTQGKFAQVDDSVYDYLIQFNWYASKYKHTWYAKRNGIFMHRFIYGLTDRKIQIDHKDRDGLNNQGSNLRICNQSQNNANRKGSGKSIYVGVAWKSNRSKWEATIRTGNGGRRYLGQFKNEKEAALAYNNAAIEVHGEFANLNVC